MNLTRRGLFGLLGKAAAAAGLTKIVGALPAAAPVAAASTTAAPFAGSFTFPHLIYTSTTPFIRTFGCCSIWPCSHTPQREWQSVFRTWPWTHCDPNIPGPVSQHEWIRDPIGYRVREHCAWSKRVRRSHPAARAFWGLP